MNTLKKPKISLGLLPVGLVALLAMSATSLVAQSTPPNAGAVVDNVATVNYEIDDVPQPPVEDNEDFTIDALVNPVVTAGGGVTAVPGQSDVAFPFTVENAGNQPQDYVLDAVNRADDEGQLDNIRIYHDVNGDGLLDAGDVLIDITDQTGSQANGVANNPFDNIQPGESFDVIVVGDVPAAGDPGTITGSDTVSVDLVAVAFEEDGTDRETQTPNGSLDQDTKDIFLADANGPADDGLDGDTDAAHSDTNTATADIVTVNLTKTAQVVDASGNPTDQFYIPGAFVEYTLTIDYDGSTTNTAGQITLSDPIPADTTFVSGTITLNGTGLTDGDDADAGDFDVTNSGAVTVTIPGTRAGDAADDVITFRVEIDDPDSINP